MPRHDQFAGKALDLDTRLVVFKRHLRDLIGQVRVGIQFVQPRRTEVAEAAY